MAAKKPASKGTPRPWPSSGIVSELPKEKKEANLAKVEAEIAARRAADTRPSGAPGKFDRDASVLETLPTRAKRPGKATKKPDVSGAMGSHLLPERDSDPTGRKSAAVTESLPETDPRMKPAVKKTRGKRKPISKEERFARSEAANRELDAEAAPTQSLSDWLHGAHSKSRGARYSGEGPESGRLVSTTEYPIPTSKNADGTGARPYVPKQGSAQGMSDEEHHIRLLRNVDSELPHKIEAAKKLLNTHIETKGHAWGQPSICQGPGCRNRIAFDEDKDYCGGGSCHTATASSTPTPRPSSTPTPRPSSTPRPPKSSRGGGTLDERQERQEMQRENVGEIL